LQDCKTVNASTNANAPALEKTVINPGKQKFMLGGINKI
jgi:hypothetical protein